MLNHKTVWDYIFASSSLLLSCVIKTKCYCLCLGFRKKICEGCLNGKVFMEALEREVDFAG